MYITRSLICNRYLNYLLKFNTYLSGYLYLINALYKRSTNDARGTISILKSSLTHFQLVGINCSINYYISGWKYFNIIPIFKTYNA